jgi:Zn-dependent protease with chaperone function
MTQGQFKAILAHEYGHFSNRDTAGGNVAMQVNASMGNMARQLAVKGLAQWYSPVWLFVNVFYRIFLRVTLGASRLQEVLADRYAAMAYGSANLIEGLLHVVKQSVAFHLQVDEEIRGAVEQNRELNNLYVLSPLEGKSYEAAETRYKQIFHQPTSMYDSHPSLQDRQRLVASIQSPRREADDENPVWDLIPDAEELKSKMTQRVAQNIQLRQMQRTFAQRQKRGGR